MAHYLLSIIYAFAAVFGFLHARPYSQQRSSNNRNSSLLADGKIYSGEATYYDPSMGACGILSDGSEFVCAIADSLYDTETIGGNPNNNAFCNRQISVTGPLGTTVVTIVDRCGSCQGGALDLSRPAFNQIGDPINGRIPITWRFI